MRYKFLVLFGPSGLGKTEFAMSFAKSLESGLELNCIIMDHPPLREYDDHDLVGFDECSASCILKNRKVFRAPAKWVNLGSSPTNRYVYSSMLPGVKIVVSRKLGQRTLERVTGKPGLTDSECDRLAWKEPLWVKG